LDGFEEEEEEEDVTVFFDPEDWGEDMPEEDYIALMNSYNYILYKNKIGYFDSGFYEAL
jgi:hypothetical protein